MIFALIIPEVVILTKFDSISQFVSAVVKTSWSDENWIFEGAGF